jgi:hypothetical protein
VGAYAQVGQRLIERGFAAIPIVPGTKRPGFYHAGRWVGLSNWQGRFKRGVPPEAERMRWAQNDSGVGIITGPASHGTVAIDIDTDDQKIMAAILAVLPPTPIKKRGAKGETLFYCAPHIQASTSWSIDSHRVVDLIGPGRQTVLHASSRHRPTVLLDRQRNLGRRGARPAACAGHRYRRQDFRSSGAVWLSSGRSTHGARQRR